MKLKYSTWQAVSTKDQAKENKVSLKVQLEACIAVGTARGWIHVRDHTVPGQTRTQWVSLYHAEKNIPQLHALLESASRREFDVLVLYDLNRFRDLMKQIFDVLCDYGIQLYILSDPREPVHPKDYTEERKNETALTVGVRGIISQQEITTLRKHYRDKMPERIKTKRLHPGLGHPPYGYTKPPDARFDRNAVLIHVPEQVRTLRLIKDWFLHGDSLTAIASRLNEQGIPSPRGKKWWYSIVSYLLANPYYAGIVQFGSTQRIRNRRAGTVTRKKNTPISAQGRHQPVWDVPTHLRILSELQRRGKAHPGLKTRQLSRLLKCWCGSVMWAQTTPAGQYWRCSSLQPKHAYLRHDEALDLSITAIIHDLQNINDIPLPTPEDNTAQLKAESQTLKAKLKRWMDLFEDGKLSEDAITERIAALNARLKTTEDLLAKTQTDLARNAATRKNLHTLAASIHTLPHYIRTAPPAQINAELHQLLHALHITPQKTITPHWK